MPYISPRSTGRPPSLPAATPPCPFPLQRPSSAQAQLPCHLQDTAREDDLTLEPPTNLHPSKVVLSHPVFLSPGSPLLRRSWL